MRYYSALFLTFLIPLCSAQRPEWDDVSVLHVGTEKPHATMMVYPSADLARAANRAASPWFQLLNGTWKFHGVLRPADRPLTFFRPDYDDSAWRNIPVPSSWQMHGFDIPYYTNIIYPWPQDASKPTLAAPAVSPEPGADQNPARKDGRPHRESVPQMFPHSNAYNQD